VLDVARRHRSAAGIPNPEKALADRRRQGERFPFNRTDLMIRQPRVVPVGQRVDSHFVRRVIIALSAALRADLAADYSARPAPEAKSADAVGDHFCGSGRGSTNSSLTQQMLPHRRTWLIPQGEHRGLGAPCLR